MKKFFSFVATLMLTTWGAWAQGPIMADEVAAIVGNGTILLSDIEKQAQLIDEDRKSRGEKVFSQTPREEAFELLIMQTLLSQRARRDSLDKEMSPIDAYVEQEVARMVDKAGGLSALEKSMGKPIYQIRSDLARRIQDMELGRMMEQKIREKVKITYDEVKAFTESIPADSLQKIPAQYSFSKIVKLPPQTDERKYMIRERLLDMRRQVQEDGKSFATLARLYSMDGTARQGGEMGPMDVRQLVGPFVAAIEDMKPGQVSEIVETIYGLHIIELISYSAKEQQAHFRHILFKPEFTTQEEEQVVAQLDSIASEVRAGRLDFKEAALRFSDDNDSKQNGGKSFNIMPYKQTMDIKQASSRYLPDELYPVDFRQISRLKPGEVSAPYQTMVETTGDIVYQIIRLDEIIPPHMANIDQDYDIIEIFALADKQQKETQKWIDKAITEMYIKIMPAFKDYKFSRQGLETKKN